MSIYCSAPAVLQSASTGLDPKARAHAHAGDWQALPGCPWPGWSEPAGTILCTGGGGDKQRDDQSKGQRSQLLPSRRLAVALAVTRLSEPVFSPPAPRKSRVNVGEVPRAGPGVQVCGNSGSVSFQQPSPAVLGRACWGASGAAGISRQQVVLPVRVRGASPGQAHHSPVLGAGSGPPLGPAAPRWHLTHATVTFCHPVYFIQV